MRLTLYRGDCLDYMRRLPDRSVITIADPPYGIGRDWEKRDWRHRMKYRGCAYMNRRPPAEFFSEMMRVSRDWVVWGWNYFTDVLPPTNYLVVWDKMSNQNQVIRYSKCEIAGTSYRVPCNLVSLGWDGYRMGEETGQKKIHPHQKPVALYRWLLREYVGPVFDLPVLDPFMGSGSCALACLDAWADYVGCETEPMFFDSAERRIREACAGTRATVETIQGETHADQENASDKRA